MAVGADVPFVPGAKSSVADRLLINARNGQWRPDADIDWDLPVQPPSWLARKHYAAVISHFLDGERATIEICRGLQSHMAEPVARQLLMLQIGDERRHASVYESYLQRLGDIAATDPAVAEVLNRSRNWEGNWLGPIVAFHIVVEGEALQMQRELCAAFCCPLFSQIAARITRDEARHVAFGRIYLRHRLLDLARTERLEIFLWVHSLWWDCASAVFGRWRLGRYLARDYLTERWTRQVETLIEIGLIAAEDKRVFI
ncbi:MAG: ferritin-like domain-containing protein [Alphaproteobacteria bacterium]|nr:ferritin-like domain-containing protein [Alphaproteobacteria bacterium]